MKTVSILGCGWLGIPLAQALIENGFRIKGSTTSKNKLQLLHAKGIEPFLISLEPDGVEGDLAHFLDSDVLIVDIPPRFHFSNKIESLVPFVEQSRVKKVLLVSSISVYDHEAGKITESIIPSPTTEKARQLFDAENALGSNVHFDATVLRFGGLIGGDRHPVKFLAGQTDLENPDAPINLIDLQDCIAIIVKIIETELWGETFNAAAPHHPTREQYYTKKAADWQLPAPRFNREKASVGKTIDSAKLQRMLGYEFLKPDL